MDERKPVQPTQGGTYERMKDGTLRQIEAPTHPARFVPKEGGGYVVEPLEPAAPAVTGASATEE